MNALSTDQKGQIALLKVLMVAANKGAVALLPTVPARYDLVLDFQGKLYRAQVKYASGKAQRSQGAIRLDLRRRKKCYSSEEVDVILVYVPQIDKVCWLAPEVFHNKACLHLRLLSTKNGQKDGCGMIDDLIW